MTIKEIEIRSGMTRANIRYYEQEGLLAPERLENGYRNYSEEDLRELDKIKLLRALGLSLEDIRAARQGERPLEGLLSEQLPRLEDARQKLENAEMVCDQMRRERVTYAGLDAPRYLAELTRPELPEEDAVPRVQASWRRFLARALDYSLYKIVLLALPVALFTEYRLSRLVGIAMTVAGILLTCVLEPVLLHFWGTTPGKWLLGLSVQDEEGGRLSWSAAWERTIGVLFYGEGLMVPLVSLWRNYRSWRVCDDGGVLPWEGESVLVLKDEKPWRWWAWAGAYGLAFVLLSLACMMQLTPGNRGPMTLPDYVENVNQQAKLYEYAKHMGEDGQWLEEEIPPNAILIGPEYAPPVYDYTLDEDGYLREIRFSIRQEAGDGELLSDYQTDRLLPTLAVVRTRDGLFHCASDPLIEQLVERGGDTWELELAGVRVCQQVEAAGYFHTDFGYILPNEADPETAFVEIHFAIELLDEIK